MKNNEVIVMASMAQQMLHIWLAFGSDVCTLRYLQSCIVGAMAPLADGSTYHQWSMAYNPLSFGITAMGCATIVF